MFLAKILTYCSTISQSGLVDFLESPPDAQRSFANALRIIRSLCCNWHLVMAGHNVALDYEIHVVKKH